MQPIKNQQSTMAEIRLTILGNDKESSFALSTIRDGSKELYCVDNSSNMRFKIKEGGQLDSIVTWSLEEDDYKNIEEPKNVVEERLLGLQAEWLENVAQGFESESGAAINSITLNDLKADDIFIELKPFSLKQIKDLIDSEDLEMSPSFQRNFIWDKTRQSRLIESIFMGLPLPSCYLSQYRDGLLTVVDGLQRLSTIHRFLRNELRLTNLEYLKDCEGKNYEELKLSLSPLRIRKFGQVQIMCFVIDYRSPSRLKYDLFRRLNTGGKPLNSQEIRNCLSRKPLQDALRQMVGSDEFKKATTSSLRDDRMDAQEAALRFMYFYDQYSTDNPIGVYDGNMDNTLNDYVDTLNQRTDFTNYIENFKTAMNNAEYLFGDKAFRKVSSDSQSRRGPINKLLFIAVSVLLAKHKNEYAINNVAYKELVAPMITLIEDIDRPDFFNAITWSTNSRANIKTAISILKTDLLDKYLLS